MDELEYDDYLPPRWWHYVLGYPTVAAFWISDMIQRVKCKVRGHKPDESGIYCTRCDCHLIGE